MTAIERLKKYEDVELDRVILLIRSGEIKAGKYSKLVKVDKHKIEKGKEFFNNEK